MIARSNRMMEKNRLGMVLFLGSEVVFFGVLILAYLYYTIGPVQDRSGPTILDPLTTGLWTICLLLSSVTLWLAHRSGEHGNQGGLRLWLLVTLLLGSAFLFGQVLEYSHLFEQRITIDRSLFATTFFTLTGFHGLHVLSGLIAILILFGLAVRGHLSGKRMIAVSTVELYWHFVDGVWIVVFVLVYLWPLLW
jgi:heme/copper-type cytochrome/quinol oxidase subunit 3